MKEQIEKYLDFCFNAYWRDNLDILDEKIVHQILDDVGFDKEIFFRDIGNDKIKLDLKKFTNDAFKKDIFGAPTFVVNKKIFWGQDRLDYAIEELNFCS